MRDVRRLLFVVCCVLFVANCMLCFWLLLNVGCSVMFVTCRVLRVVCCVLCVVCRLMFVVCCVLLVVVNCFVVVICLLCAVCC